MEENENQAKQGSEYNRDCSDLCSSEKFSSVEQAFGFCSPHLYLWCFGKWVRISTVMINSFLLNLSPNFLQILLPTAVTYPRQLLLLRIYGTTSLAKAI